MSEEEPERGSGIVYWLVTLGVLLLFSSLITLIGAYIAHRGRSEEDDDWRFWDVIRWKPWIITVVSGYATMFVFPLFLWLVPNIVGFFVVRNRYKKIKESNSGNE